jgi:hypothetical protein
VELLRPGGLDAARRLVAALTLVPEAEREEVVVEIERRIVEVYAPSQTERICIVHPPAQHNGYIEEVRAEYEVMSAAPAGLEPAAARNGHGAGGRAALRG